MTKAVGSQYGSFLWLALAMATPMVVLCALVALLSNQSAGTWVGPPLVMVLFAWLLHKTSTVTVDRSDVTIKTLFGGISVPWSDVASIEPHRFRAALVRMESGRRVWIQILDPGWKDRPVGRAIFAHLNSEELRREVEES